MKEFIALGRSPYTGWLGKLSEEDLKEIENVISIMKMEKLQDKLFNQLSDGEKQKVLIARALCQQTPVIVLDEPTAFLDFRNKKEILELLSSVSNDLNASIALPVGIEVNSFATSEGCIKLFPFSFVILNKPEKSPAKSFFLVSLNGKFIAAFYKMEINFFIIFL